MTRSTEPLVHVAALTAPASDPYAEGIRFAVAAGLRATSDNDDAGGANRVAGLDGLLTLLCARADLTALGLVLPAYLGDLGTAPDRQRLLTALHVLHARRSLPIDEQELLRGAIDRLDEQQLAADFGRQQDHI